MRPRTQAPPTLTCDVLALIDTARLQAAVRAAAAHAPSSHSAAKYLDHQFWAPHNRARALQLGLGDGVRRRCVDLGCGAGYFVAACQALGHDALGLDRPLDAADAVERIVYGAFREALPIPRVDHQIRRFEPLPDIGSPDLVTAFAVCFNGHGTAALWDVEEWIFFLDDVRSRLQPGGRLVLWINAEADGRSLRPHVEEHLRSWGACIDGHYVKVTR